MVLFSAAEDGMVFGIGSAEARIGRPLTSVTTIAFMVIFCLVICLFAGNVAGMESPFDI
jgi:hypothetical protein